jgi:hypothetical protein
LSASAIAASQLLGPNQVLSGTASVNVATSAGNLILSWPVANGGFTLETSRSSPDLNLSVAAIAA